MGRLLIAGLVALLTVAQAAAADLPVGRWQLAAVVDAGSGVLGPPDIYAAAAVVDDGRMFVRPDCWSIAGKLDPNTAAVSATFMTDRDMLCRLSLREEPFEDLAEVLASARSYALVGERLGLRDAAGKVVAEFEPYRATVPFHGKWLTEEFQPGREEWGYDVIIDPRGGFTASECVVAGATLAVEANRVIATDIGPRPHRCHSIGGGPWIDVLKAIRSFELKTNELVFLGENGKQVALLKRHRARMGIYIEDVEAAVRDAPVSVLVTRVRPRSLAARSGIKRGDIIVAFEGTEVRGHAHLTELISAFDVDVSPARLTMIIDGEEVQREIWFTRSDRIDPMFE